MHRDSYNSHSTSSHALSVSELNKQARHLLERSFLTIEVQGELSNFVRPSSGHWYFTLKDSQAQVRCAMFRNRNGQIRFQPKNGDTVIVRAKVSLYEGRGDYQLICEQMIESGSGQLQQSFEALKAKLEQEGLFSAEHKQTIPTHAEHLGIITSASGAAVHDILTVLKRRYPALPVSIYPSSVQGDEAVGQLCQAIALANKHPSCDVLIIGRGGGSQEDLQAFNDERLARAIFNSQIPIISAVGHEVDFSIADFVADLRAATPSAAAELISPDQQALYSQLYQLKHRLRRQLQQRLVFQQSRIDNISSRLRHPGEILRQQNQHLDGLELRLQQAIRHKAYSAKQQLKSFDKRLNLTAPQRQINRQRLQLEQLQQRFALYSNRIPKQKQQHLARLAARLNAVSPLATLDRGYAIVQSAVGTVIESSDQIAVGDQLQTRLKHGTINCQVTELIDKD